MNLQMGWSVLWIGIERKNGGDSPNSKNWWREATDAYESKNVVNYEGTSVTIAYTIFYCKFSALLSFTFIFNKASGL